MEGGETIKMPAVVVENQAVKLAVLREALSNAERELALLRSQLGTFEELRGAAAIAASLLDRIFEVHRPEYVTRTGLSEPESLLGVALRLQAALDRVPVQRRG